MATVRAILWKHKTNKDGHHPIYLRIEAGGKTRYKSLREYVPRSQWNDKSATVRKGHPRASKINAKIGRNIAEAKDEILNLELDEQAVTATELKRRISDEPEPEETPVDFFAFADEIADQFERQGKIYNARRYRSICGKLEKMTGRPLPFTHFTPAFLREYETYLIEKYKNKQNTVASNMRCIRAILYRAIRDALMEQGDNPFFQYKIKREKPSRDKLTLEEVKRIEGLDLEEGSLIWHVRNYWLFSFYCAGIRFADVAMMRCKNVEGGRLDYTMRKTGGRKSMKLVPPAKRIADYYCKGDREAFLFPMMNGYPLRPKKKLLNAIASQNALINKYLKKIGAQAGLSTPLSFHISRHSFADIARTEGWDVYNISKALGHSDLRTTEHYLRGFDSDALDEKMDDLFGGTK